MSVLTLSPAALLIDRARPRPASSRQLETEWWTKPLRLAALSVFVAIPLGAPLTQAAAGRVVWTMVVAQHCPLGSHCDVAARGQGAGRWRLR